MIEKVHVPLVYTHRYFSVNQGPRNTSKLLTYRISYFIEASELDDFVFFCRRDVHIRFATVP